ncbi:MAG: rod shape-determining protein MreD, partial [Bacteroidota bacterium]|nr:rod shape-determining protein MreD [Bacteroidota bacterium]
IIRLLVITLLLLTLQTTVVAFTSIANIVPDIMVIWIVYIAVTEGQIQATLFGFGIGLAVDLVSGQFLGLSALSKTTAGFLAGYFFNDNKTQNTLSHYQFLIIVGVVSLVHNVIYFVIFTRGSDVGLLTAIFEFGIFSALYTTAIAFIPMTVYARRPQLR